MVNEIANEDVGDVTVIRNNGLTVAEASKFKKIILSPGPGLPTEAGIMTELVRELAPTHKILGVCLGHQCIGEVFGGKLENLSNVIHGKGIATTITCEDEKIYQGLPKTFMCGRYHSWVVSQDEFPDELLITSEDSDGYIMSLRHKEFDVVGVQYHPESVLTPEGHNLIRNWLK